METMNKERLEAIKKLAETNPFIKRILLNAEKMKAKVESLKNKED